MTEFLARMMRRVMRRRSFPEHMRDAVPHEAGSVDGLPKMGHVHDMEAVAAAIDASRKRKSLTVIPQAESVWEHVADAHRAAQQQVIAEWERVRDRAASQGPRHHGDVEVRVFVRAGMEYGRPEMLMEIQRETLGWWRR